MYFNWERNKGGKVCTGNDTGYRVGNLWSVKGSMASGTKKMEVKAWTRGASRLR